MKVILLHIAVILGPSYIAAYLTDKMVYVVPTLAASIMVSAKLNEMWDDAAPSENRARVDEEAVDSSNGVQPGEGSNNAINSIDTNS